MREPEKHPGTLVVEGVVQTVSKKEQTLALIDVEEYRKCRVVTCSQLALPVRWAGEMPAVLDIVQVQGEVTKVNGKMLFAARKLAKVPETPLRDVVIRYGLPEGILKDGAGNIHAYSFGDGLSLRPI